MKDKFFKEHNINKIVKKINKEVQKELDSPEVQMLRNAVINGLSISHPVLGIAASFGNEMITNYSRIKLSFLLKGLSSNLDCERQLNELYNFVKGNKENAFSVATLFYQMIMAESLKTCVIYGIILADHLQDEEKPLSRSEHIVCRALLNATDYDLDTFKKIMEMNLTDSDSNVVSVKRECLKDEEYVNTCEWCVYNRIFKKEVPDFGDIDDQELESEYYLTKYAYLLKDYIIRASQIWDYD